MQVMFNFSLMFQTVVKALKATV